MKNTVKTNISNIIIDVEKMGNVLDTLKVLSSEYHFTSQYFVNKETIELKIYSKHSDNWWCNMLDGMRLNNRIYVC